MAEKKKSTKPKGNVGKPPTLAERIMEDTIGGYRDRIFIPKNKDENEEVRRVFKGN